MNSSARTLPRTLLGALLALTALSACRIPRWNRPVPVEHPINTTRSGILLQDELQGLGPKVTPYSEVTLDYRVTLQNSQLVDSSYDRGLPITFTMGNAPIPGWEEALIGMRAGGIRVAEIPPEQAYGEAGIEGLIPPNAVLLCRFEMLEVAEPRPDGNAEGFLEESSGREEEFEAAPEELGPTVPDSDPAPPESGPRESANEPAAEVPKGKPEGVH